MIDTAEVFLWGTRIGIVHQDEGKSYISFEYDKKYFKKSNSGRSVTVKK